MKKIIFFLLFCPLMIKAQSGSITGQIIDSEGFPLPGAIVRIIDSNLGAVSDAAGIYRINGLSAGEYQLMVSYIGYLNTSETVTVEEGKSSTYDFTLTPGADIEGVIIVGLNLQNTSRALNRQKNNDNITNVVSKDQIGRFPDANIGDAVKRVPGITVQNDQGEARDIVIRGMPRQFNSVTLNGDRIPSAEGDNRNIQLDLIPADMIQLVEVNKAVLPEMDADAIGGSVDLITRNAANDPRISATFSPGFSPIRDEMNWTGALVAGNRFFDGKLGAVFSGSFNRQDYGSDNIEAEYNGDNENPTLDDFQIRRYDLVRKRVSGGLDLDYKFNENHRVEFKTLISNRKDWENRFRLRYTDIETDEDTGITTAQIRRQTKGGIDQDNIRNQRLEEQNVQNFKFGGEHILGKIEADWGLSYANSSEERPDERYISFRQRDVVSTISGVGSDNPFINRNDAFNAADFDLREITDENQFTEEEHYLAKAKFKLPILEGANRSNLKFGYKFRRQEKVRRNDFTEYENDAIVDRMSDVSFSDQSDSNYQPGSQYQIGNFATPEFLGNLNLNDFESESLPEEFAANNYDADETVNAAFLQYKQHVGEKISFIVGARYEHTSLENTGNQLTDEGDFTTTSGSSSYDNFMPGIHFNYRPNENAVIRTAWTNTLARPNYFDLTPYRLIEDLENGVADVGEVGNPELDPTTSSNFDISGEYYFESIGLITLGGFYKSIDNFVFNFVQEDVMFDGITYNEFIQPRNGDGAELYGFEFAVQRQLDFLPGVLKNFNLYGNYTYTGSDATILERPDEDLDLAGTAPHIINASLSYEDNKFTGRVSLNHAEDYVDEYGSEAFNDRFYDKQTFLDINGNYLIRDNWRIFFEAKNLTNQPLRFYQGGNSSLVMQEEFYRQNFNLGVKFDF